MFHHLSALRGGALALTSPQASVRLYDSTFENNFASIEGGAIFVGGGTLALRRVNVHRNVATERGGGIFMHSGKLFMSRGTMLAQNRVFASGSRQGAAYFIADITASQVFYSLPAPPAHYITLTVDCRRGGCVGECQ